jgi:hypothetical protein
VRQTLGDQWETVFTASLQEMAQQLKTEDYGIGIILQEVFKLRAREKELLRTILAQSPRPQMLVGCLGQDELQHSILFIANRHPFQVKKRHKSWFAGNTGAVFALFEHVKCQHWQGRRKCWHSNPAKVLQRKDTICANGRGVVSHALELQTYLKHRHNTEQNKKEFAMKNMKFNHLVLLIGTNPLPDFVVADYFLNKNSNLKKIWLIHSEKNNRQAGTNEQADNFEKILQERWSDHKTLEFPLERISLSDVSSSRAIHNDIERKKMLDELSYSGGFHFNYTGGTKSMSTHVYWILKELQSSVEKSFSYLDARNFSLISDDDDNVLDTDLRNQVLLSFGELIALHGFKRKNKAKEFLFSNSLDAFNDLIENDKLEEFYEQETRGYDRALFTDARGRLAEKISKLTQSNSKKLQTFQPNDAFRSVLCVMPENYLLFNDNDQFNDCLTPKKFKYVIKFLDGEWLEYHVLKSLEQFFESKEIQIEQNWEIKKPDWPANQNFELDVLLIQGYHLTGISCTTERKNKALCKSKGFEIIHRTRQIGGDEAKAILITFLDKNSRDLLQQELQYETGNSQSNILVMGLSDIKKEIMTRKINKFLFGN